MRLLSVKPGSCQGQRVQGYVALFNDDYKTATLRFREALKADPEAPSADKVAAELTRAFYKQGKPADAENFAGSYIIGRPGAMAVYDVLAEHYQGNSDHAKLVALLQKRIQSNPNDATSYLKLASAYSGAGQSVEMERVLEHLRADPSRFPNGLEQAGGFS